MGEEPGIDQAEPDQAPRHRADGRHGRAGATVDRVEPVCRHVGGVPGGRHVEARSDRPFVEDQRLVDGSKRRLPGAGLDDQCSVQPAILLRCAVLVRVIPVGSGDGRNEGVAHRRAGGGRVLGDARHPVLAVGHRDAVPVNRRGLRKLVVEGHPDQVAHPDAQRRSRDGPVVRPRRDRVPYTQVDRGGPCGEVEAADVTPGAGALGPPDGSTMAGRGVVDELHADRTRPAATGTTRHRRRRSAMGPRGTWDQLSAR